MMLTLPVFTNDNHGDVEERIAWENAKKELLHLLSLEQGGDLEAARCWGRTENSLDELPRPVRHLIIAATGGPRRSGC